MSIALYQRLIPILLINSTNEYYADANIGFGDIELMKSNRE